jgi:hypothetical protein
MLCGDLEHSGSGVSKGLSNTEELVSVGKGSRHGDPVDRLVQEGA